MAGACTQPAQPQPRLIDETSTVLDWQFHLAPDLESSEPETVVHIMRAEYVAIEEAGAVAVDPIPGWDFLIVWGALPCQLAPTVRVSGADGQITAIHVDYGPQLGPGECPASFAIHGVDIRTSRTPGADIAVTGGETPTGP